MDITDHLYFSQLHSLHTMFLEILHLLHNLFIALIFITERKT